MTIIDVAEVAGVSKSTVSRVINGNSSVKPEIARLVRQTMEDMGYKPPLKRRGPKPARTTQHSGIYTGNIGLLIIGRTREFLENPSVARSLSGFTEAIQAESLNPMVIEMPDSSAVPDALLRRAIDGLVVTGVDMTREMTDFLSSFPMVWQGGIVPLIADADLVTTDNRAVGVLACQHLIENGCQDMAYINHDSKHGSFSVRRDSFMSTATENNATARVYEQDYSEIPEKDFWDMDFVRSAYSNLIDTMLNDGLPDGIFIPTDQQCSVLHSILKDRGIIPGKDTITISCNNDSNWLTAMHPRPASINLRTDEQGSLAAKRLLERIKNPLQDPIVTLVSPKVVPPLQQTV